MGGKLLDCVESSWYIESTTYDDSGIDGLLQRVLDEVTSLSEGECGSVDEEEKEDGNGGGGVVVVVVMCVVILVLLMVVMIGSQKRNHGNWQKIKRTRN